MGHNCRSNIGTVPAGAGVGSLWSKHLIQVQVFNRAVKNSSISWDLQELKVRGSPEKIE